MTAKEFLDMKGIYSLDTKKRTNEVYQWMEEFALHIAEQAVEEEKAGFRKKGGTGFGSHVCDNILSRIKQLINE